jgi:hypothetical protein
LDTVSTYIEVTPGVAGWARRADSPKGDVFYAQDFC